MEQEEGMELGVSSLEQAEHNVIAAFSATLPDIQSALSIGGDGSCRIKIDVPESEIAEVMKLAAYGRGKVLVVTVQAKLEEA